MSKRLLGEYKQIQRNINYFYSVKPNVNNFLHWDFCLLGPPDSIYEGGIFEGYLKFPINYPNSPPKLVFKTPLFHPNVYQDGKVCISILNEGVDPYGYENISERWSPSHSVESIMMSIISMLASPNIDSPANVDASKMYRDNYSEFKKLVYKQISKTQK